MNAVETPTVKPFTAASIGIAAKPHADKADKKATKINKKYETKQAIKMSATLMPSLALRLVTKSKSSLSKTLLSKLLLEAAPTIKPNKNSAAKAA